ncbi:MAG: OmcA/MtrC family decaheme c-type cytochrome [Deltaproteobacteria bacterium]|nr:OmcA/MtrC family decaheme c-type cytochrome [Deltaproteobacteria bacterium]
MTVSHAVESKARRAEIVDVGIDPSDPLFTTTTVRFTLFDDGNPVTGLSDAEKAAFELTVAKLLPPPRDDDSALWQSYINRTDGTPAVVQATSESPDEPDSLLHVGLPDGTWAYTLGFDIERVGELIDPDDGHNAVLVPYEPSLLHRVGLWSPDLADAASFDWVPDGSEADTRYIVDSLSCAGCHPAGVFHHGSNVDVCVTCHNPGSYDAQSPDPGDPEMLDLAVITHKLHMGPNLPSVISTGSYTVAGVEYGDVSYPRSIEECTVCHDGTAGAPNETQEGDNWWAIPTNEACTTCHDDVDVTTGQGHPVAELPDNRICRACHGQGTMQDTTLVHRPPLHKVDAFVLVGVTGTGVGQATDVSFQVLEWDGSDTEPIDILTDPRFDGGSVAVTIGWGGDNAGNATALFPGQPVTIDALAPGVAIRGADDVFTVTSPVAVPPEADDYVVVALRGAAVVDGEQQPLANVAERFDLLGGDAPPARQVATTEACEACHGTLARHDGRDNDIDGCLICHNGSATDVTSRLAVLAVGTGDPALDFEDGLAEQSMELRTLIHGIHAAESRVTAYQLLDDEAKHRWGDVRYPGRVQQCETCHVAGTYVFPLDPEMGPVATATGSDASGADIGHTDDDLHITPISATCASCHDEAIARFHMIQMGGGFDARDAEMP